MEIRAIFIGDISFSECPVFEYIATTNQYEMLSDRMVAYDKEVVEQDDDFLLFRVEADVATLLTKARSSTF